ncbi:LOW QUALITY PROTEIN: scavenger receptor cysteine-rich type 1 protein M130-like [Leptosomus discolor]
MVPVRVLGLLLCVQLCRGSAELRLVGGGGRCAGRVEVKHEGEWGSVCAYDFDWDARWATVVCRQLGCGTAAKASPYTRFGQGTGRIWLQPFFCRGAEEVLENCPHFGWGQHFCGHDMDLGVTCTEAVELRLVAGGGPCAGRVEVKLQGHWGSVADDDWNIEDAEVVCQQVGCGSAASAHHAGSHFGKGDGFVGLALVNCRGDEALLWDCEIRGWGPYTGPHDFDTSVICQGFARLVGGDAACAGRLEVRRGRAWAGVCEDDVDIKAAQVVCRELGCGTALAVSGTGRFEAGTGPLWEGGFECTGTEPLLTACTRRPPRGQGCAGRASIVCSPYTGFRLAANGSGCAGRVEAETGGTWGSLCAAGWDLPDAHVLCRHLGCGSAVAVPPGGSFGAGSGSLRRDAFGCVGSERHPGECPVAVLGEPSCPPGHAAAVNCSGIAEPLRLVEGESRCDGRLEVATSPGAWARVPAGLWDARGAGVVCRQLGCGVPEKVYAVPGSGTAGLLGLRCAGTEESLAWCNTSAAAAAPTGSPEEVAVVCSGSRRVRLSGGPGRCAGRVEVYLNGTWGTVCQETWDTPDATVVCRQLGCGAALAAPGSARFGAGTGPLWPGAGGCVGTEATLWDCPASAPHGCRRGGGAGAVCSEQLSLRLAGGGGRCKGHLEVFYNGTWGRVCANGTGAATATAACRQLGCGDQGTLVADRGGDPAPAWLAWVGCEEGARSLWRCRSAPWRLQACSPGGDAYVECEEDGDGTSGTPPRPWRVAARTVPLAQVALPVPAAPRAGLAGVPLLTPPGHVPAGDPGSTTTLVPTVLCVVLGTLLCLALGALAVLACRVRRRGPGRAEDAVSDAIYEELDYTPMPDYQEHRVLVVQHRLVPVACSHRGPVVPAPATPNAPAHPPPGSLSEGSGTKLPYYSGDSAEEGDPKAAPDSPGQHGPPDGYDDVAAVPEESPAPGPGDISEGVARRSWGCGPPPGGSSRPPSPPGAARDPLAQPLGDTDYDDAGISTPGTSL